MLSPSRTLCLPPVSTASAPLSLTCAPSPECSHCPLTSDGGAGLPRGPGDSTAWGGHCVSFSVVFSLLLRSSCESGVGEMCSKHHLWHPGEQQPPGKGWTWQHPGILLGLELPLGLAGETGPCPGTHPIRVGMSHQTITPQFFPKPPHCPVCAPHSLPLHLGHRV